MSRFFDLKNRTLHAVHSYAGAVKFSVEIKHQAKSIKALSKIEELSTDDLPPKLTLRRQDACQDQTFFSRDTQTIIIGSFSPNHSTNLDLVEIGCTKNYI